MGAKRMRTSRQQLIEEPATLADRTANGAGADAEPARELALEPDFWAIHSKAGVHVGPWPNKAHADEALCEYDGGTITPLYRATHEHQEGFRQGIEAAAKMADYFEETIYSEGMSEDVYYGISCTVSQIAREIRALSSPDHADAGKLDAVGDDDTCTCCHGTGWYESMERHCDCEDGLKSSGAIADSDFGLEAAARFHESEAEHYEAHAGDKDGIPFPIVAGWHRLNAERIRALASADAGKVEGDGAKWPIREVVAKAIAYHAVGDPHARTIRGDQRWEWFTDEADKFISVFGCYLPSAPSQEAAGS